jgi:hypothetical protein
MELRHRGRGQAVLNVAMRLVLATPVLRRVVGGRVLVVEVVGRRTGRRYRIPVGYVRDGDRLLVGTAGTWRRNLVPGRPVPVTVAGRRVLAEHGQVTRLDDCLPLYRRILAHNPVHGRYAGVPHAADGTPDPDALRAALARGLAVVTLRPLPAER